MAPSPSRTFLPAFGEAPKAHARRVRSPNFCDHVMDPVMLSKIAEFSGGELSLGNDISVSRLRTDSRTLQPGDLFVALRGENFDGHKFVEQAAQRGAIGSRGRSQLERNYAKGFSHCSASTKHSSLINKSRREYRQSLPLKVVAITGSNGKTTHEGFRRRRPRHAIPGHENRREFQQSRWSAANDFGGDIEG